MSCSTWTGWPETNTRRWSRRSCCSSHPEASQTETGAAELGRGDQLLDGFWKKTSFTFKKWCRRHFPLKTNDAWAFLMSVKNQQETPKWMFLEIPNRWRPFIHSFHKRWITAGLLRPTCEEKPKTLINSKFQQKCIFVEKNPFRAFATLV